MLVPGLAAKAGYLGPPFPLSAGVLDSWTITSEKVAHDKNELAFSGKLLGANVATRYASPFTIRVIKEKDSGRWRIDYFVFERCLELPAQK